MQVKSSVEALFLPSLRTKNFKGEVIDADKIIRYPEATN